MLPHFFVLKSLFKLDNVKIDTTIFRLHYKLTVIFLAASCILVTLKQYVGDPIDCMVNSGPDQLKGPVLDTYCWIHSTFTIVEDSSPSSKSQMQGMGPPKTGKSVVRTHSYYQWVGFVLLFQTVLFYIPRWIWKTCEAGRMRELVTGLTSHSTIAHYQQPRRLRTKSESQSDGAAIDVEAQEDDESNTNKERLVDYLTASLGHHNLYAARFFICEALNLVNVTSQVYFMDVFFGGKLSMYGFTGMFNGEAPTNSLVSSSNDPLSRIFPKVGKCTFHNYGPSGSIQGFDALCVLPINIINEKIYVFLWMWFTLLAAVSGLHLIYRLAILLSAKVRSQMFQLRYRQIFQRQERSNIINDEEDAIQLISSRCRIGDWFLLCLVAENVNVWVFRDIIERLAHRIKLREKSVKLLTCPTLSSTTKPV